MDCITLSDEFFSGKQIALEVRVKVLTGGEDGDILSQYVAFTHVMNEQVREHGQTMLAAEGNDPDLQRAKYFEGVSGKQTEGGERYYVYVI